VEIEMQRAVLITGCNGGIGRALVDAFADAGWKVIGTDQSKCAVNDRVSSFFSADLVQLATQTDQMTSFARNVRKALDGPSLGALINNAAVQSVSPFNNLSTEDILKSLYVNSVAPMLLAKAFLPELRYGKGAIINIGSVHATATKPEFSAYSVSKSALHGVTRALAVELGPDVRVVTLAPAATATDMLLAGFEGKQNAFRLLENCHPAGRIAAPEEIGKLAVFLTSDDAGFLTGTTIYADGGVLARLHDPA
jgi:NAD(P)-dependent dehydrogenase (short-subunit alcohol dehydrogenase family)